MLSTRGVAMARLLSAVRRPLQATFFSTSLRTARTEWETRPSQHIAVSCIAAGIMVIGVSSSAFSWSNQTQLDGSLDAAEGGIIGISDDNDDDKTTNVINWSGTHSVTVANEHYWEPESVEEVEAIIKECNARGQSVRPIGSSLSPNGLAFNSAGMIAMANLDKVIEINLENLTVTAQAGVTVSQVSTLKQATYALSSRLNSILQKQLTLCTGD
jgi:hypothetical protein